MASNLNFWKSAWKTIVRDLESRPDAQISLLRVSQEKEIERTGGSEPKKIDVRIIAATNAKFRGKNGAAELLEMNRSTLRNKMKKLRIIFGSKISKI